MLRIIDESYEKKGLARAESEGVDPRSCRPEAAWRPRLDRHSIVENVVHCAYWKYAVSRRLTGEKRGSFSLKGSNWFAIRSAC